MHLHLHLHLHLHFHLHFHLHPPYPSLPYLLLNLPLTVLQPEQARIITLSLFRSFHGQVSEYCTLTVLDHVISQALFPPLRIIPRFLLLTLFTSFCLPSFPSFPLSSPERRFEIRPPANRNLLLYLLFPSCTALLHIWTGGARADIPTDDSHPIKG